MERLTKNGQLHRGTKFHVVEYDKITNYEYLCEIPNCKGCFLAQNSKSNEVEKIYRKKLFKSEAYLGTYDPESTIKQTIWYLEEIMKTAKDGLAYVRIMRAMNNKLKV